MNHVYRFISRTGAPNRVELVRVSEGPWYGDESDESDDDDDDDDP